MRQNGWKGDPIEYVERFTTRQGVPTTWGEAIELRVGI